MSIEDLKPDENEGDFVPEALSDPQKSPDADAAEQLMIEQVHEMIQTVLTEKQRRAMMAA